MGTKLANSLSILRGISSSLVESNQEETSQIHQESRVETPFLVRTLYAAGLAEERSSTTFGKCGSLKGTPYKRQSMPDSKFAKKDKDNPTYPDRSCRASGAGTLRMMQYNKPPKETQKAIKANVKKNVPNMKAHGTGVGGVRMTTNKNGEKVRDVKHTPPYSPPGGSKGPSGNREVDPSPLAHAKPAHKKKARERTRTAQARNRAGK